MRFTRGYWHNAVSRQLRCVWIGPSCSWISAFHGASTRPAPQVVALSSQLRWSATTRPPPIEHLHGRFSMKIMQNNWFDPVSIIEFPGVVIWRRWRLTATCLLRWMWLAAVGLALCRLWWTLPVCQEMTLPLGTVTNVKAIALCRAGHQLSVSSYPSN